MKKCEYPVAAFVATVALAFAANAQSPASKDSAANSSYYGKVFAQRPSVAAMTAMGRTLFMDPSLSASGKIACATCHDPSRFFGPANDQAVQRGGAEGASAGVRAVPSLKYLQNVPPFTEHFFENEGNDSEDQGPAGGRTWDGRSQSAHDQARLPLFSSFEMGNPNAATVVAKVRASGYARQFREVFGQEVFDHPDVAFNDILMALEVYQQTPAEFYPYTSKYDAWLRKKATLTEQELRGLATFNDANKGNCAICHPSGIRNGAYPSFTDYGFIALGAPRNRLIPANADAKFYDLGLCGPLRTDLADRPDFCGLFRTPTLRNVAQRPVFFHNGVFKTLEDAVAFYATRDTQPQKWYPRSADGKVNKFDDLPQKYLDNIENDVPFGGKPGDRPTLTDADVTDIVAFLTTLTDGYQQP